MSRQRASVLIGVVAVLVASGGASWFNQQERPKAPTANPQVLLEREYWLRVYPYLEIAGTRQPGLTLPEALESAAAAPGRKTHDDTTLEVLFAAMRCGLVSRRDFELNFKSMRLSVEESIKRDQRRYIMHDAWPQRRRLAWFAVFSKADLDTPVGLPPSR